MDGVLEFLGKLDVLLVLLGVFLFSLAVLGRIQTKWIAVALEKPWQRVVFGIASIGLFLFALMINDSVWSESPEAEISQKRLVTIESVVSRFLPNGTVDKDSIGYRLIVNIDGDQRSFPVNSGYTSFEDDELPFTFYTPRLDKHDIRFGIIRFTKSGPSTPDFGQPFQTLEASDLPAIRTYKSGFDVTYKIE